MYSSPITCARYWCRDFPSRRKSILPIYNGSIHPHNNFPGLELDHLDNLGEQPPVLKSPRVDTFEIFENIQTIHERQVDLSSFDRKQRRLEACCQGQALVIVTVGEICQDAIAVTSEWSVPTLPRMYILLWANGGETR